MTRYTLKVNTRKPTVDDITARCLADWSVNRATTRVGKGAMSYIWMYQGVFMAPIRRLMATVRRRWQSTSIMSIHAPSRCYWKDAKCSRSVNFDHRSPTRHVRSITRPLGSVIFISLIMNNKQSAITLSKKRCNSTTISLKIYVLYVSDFTGLEWCVGLSTKFKI